MRAALWLIVCALLLAGRLWRGESGLAPWPIQIVPSLLAASVAGVFARSLARGRQPLIARAIRALDGAALLDDARVAAYARRLTLFWALWLAALAAFGLLCVLHAHALRVGVLPSPESFEWLLPVAVAGPLLIEFALRRSLLPQAPRHTLFGFVRALARAWPDLLR